MPSHRVTPEVSVFYWQDVRYALRLLARSPLFTLLTVAVLAGGLGLSIFTFSFLHTAMLKPLPLEDGDKIVRLEITTAAGSSGLIDAADFAAIRSGITSLTDLGAYASREVIVGTGERARSIEAMATEWNIFQATRALPLLGRGLQPHDQQPGAEPVIVLSYRTWVVAFGADSTLLDAWITLNGAPARVIGVMPEGYGFPVAAEAWVPMRHETLSITTPDQEYLEAYARLAPGVSAARAAAELTLLLQRAQQAHPSAARSRPVATGMRVQSFPMAQFGSEGPLVLAVLNTVAALILLLACINVTNLLLARANERARETAVRLALGAPRARLFAQSMWESVILCVAGGTLATGLAAWGLNGINTWARTHLEGNLAFWWVWGFEPMVVLSAGGFTTVAAAVLGAAVARRTTGSDVLATLQEGSWRGGGRREGRVARALVMIQVATVSVLMFFGALSGIVASRVVNIDLGYDTRNLLSASVELPETRYPDRASRGRFRQQLFDLLATQNAIDGAVLRAPLADITGPEGVFELPAWQGGVFPRAYVLAVLGPLSPLGIQLHQGRYLDARDHETAEPTVMVSAALAARYWPGTSPLGRQMRLAGLGEREQWRRVVGVVDDVLLGNPLSRDRSAIAAYIPLRQTSGRFTGVVFRHRGDVVAGEAAFHHAISTIDPLILPSNVASFDEMLAKITLMARSVARLFAGCFAFALLLAVSGTYGLMARSIGRRTRELGVRRALGATDRTILLMLLGQAAQQLGIGAVVALPLTLLVGWGFARYFPIGLSLSLAIAVLVSVAITGVVLAATWLPTRRAVAMEPRDALWRD
jgi:predicted permease